MRHALILLAAASLCACEQQGTKQAQAAEVVQPAALTFEGAGAAALQAKLAHGERLSHVLGCTGCHKPDLTGGLFNDDKPQDGALYASNLTRILPTMTDQQLETLLREGTHPTRGELWIMPSEVFQRLSAPDMAALIAHLRTVQPAGKPTPPPVLSASFKAKVASGEEKPVREWVLRYRKQVPPELGGQHAYGRYLTGATCSECHGGDLTGIEGFSPSLDLAGVYTDAELTRLLTTGKGKTPRDLGLMALVGREHFSYLTPSERKAIIAYVKARAARSQ